MLSYENGTCEKNIFIKRTLFALNYINFDVTNE
jgi:hypothetical protein